MITLNGVETSAFQKTWKKLRHTQVYNMNKQVTTFLFVFTNNWTCTFHLNIAKTRLWKTRFRRKCQLATTTAHLPSPGLLTLDRSGAGIFYGTWPTCKSYSGRIHNKQATSLQNAQKHHATYAGWKCTSWQTQRCNFHHCPTIIAKVRAIWRRHSRSLMSLRKLWNAF